MRRKNKTYLKNYKSANTKNEKMNFKIKIKNNFY